MRNFLVPARSLAQVDVLGEVLETQPQPLSSSGRPEEGTQHLGHCVKGSERDMPGGRRRLSRVSAWNPINRLIGPGVKEQQFVIIQDGKEIQA